MSDPLIDRPERFEFFQAVRLLEQAQRDAARGDPRSAPPAPVGDDADPRREAVRFRAASSLAFPAHEVTEFREAATSDGPGRPLPPPELTVAFLGLIGPSGVLPQQYTELVLRAGREKSTSLRAFLDLFHHRLISLFYRAGTKYRLALQYEAGASQGNDPVTAALYGLIGMATDHLRGRLRLDDRLLVHFAGHFAHLPRSAQALEAMLTRLLGPAVEIEQFRGRWLTISPDERSRLAGRFELAGDYARLGVTSVLGRRAWDPQGGFRIRVGPMSYAEFTQLMPGGGDFAQVVDLTQMFAGPEFAFDIQLILRAAETPACAAGGDAPARLGWNSWLTAGGLPRNADDAIFAIL